MQSKNFVLHVQQLLAKNEIAAALKALQTALEQSPKLTAVLQQSGRYHSLTDQILTGTLEAENATVIEN